MSELPIGFVDLKKLATPMEKAWLASAKERGIIRWNKTVPPEEVHTYYKISICTTCMGRLHHLKQTLPQNILDNWDYRKKLEFLILDYNSNDGLGKWVKDALGKYVESGLVAYYRTEEPKYYDMSHSRNIAFKLASGDIVNNVDSDAYTNKGFASYINRQANVQPEKATFAKSRQLLRGRLGFYKKDFIEILGGYDENLHAYGHDDQDLLNRAWELGFTLMYYGGQFCGIVEDHVKHQEGNYKKKWWETEGENRLISFTNLLTGRFKANVGKEWGKATVIKNFTEEIHI